MAVRPRAHADRPDPGDPPGDGLHQWIAALDTAYPPADAAGWDAVGLHVGEARRDRVTGVLVTLDVTDAVLDEAAQLGADLIIAHHPLLFAPLERLTGATAAGRLALRAARQGCAVLAAHTNVDSAGDGTSHPVARILGLVDTRPIQPLPAAAADAPMKLVTFVPAAATDAVIDAMSSAGAGQIGEYSGCAFVAPGTGRFTPGEGASPAIGEVGETEEVAENRIEMVLRAGEVDVVVQELIDAHPYEEVAYDVVPLRTTATSSQGRLDAFADGAKGLGRRGRLPEPRTLADIAETLRTQLPSPHLRLAAADATTWVSEVAICGGAGDSMIPSLIDPAGTPTVDLFITGDLKHHVTLDARTMGLAVIDAGHFATENSTMDVVLERLESIRTLLSLTAPLHRSTVSTDPWTDWSTDA
ncbi:Nif3-like dinuclear metal center hexameric protein [Euzebya tangerina]|uniref:Nif3-like dinuclear metal center hexameric protein n=1 Tax=Euzebya tangerina TaxID=591198 RepID=UPI0013C33215|nr:Nif3-like dinuclear metal center hexameric protein [Euzebya tangerina]